MTIQQFIFSNKRSTRFLRHLVFWVVYITFFYLQSVTPEVVLLLYHSNAFYFGWISVCCFVPACIASVYIFIYVLLPVFLQQKKYIQFAAAVFLLYGCFLAINYYMAILFFKATCNCDVSKLDFMQAFGLGNNNSFLATAIGCLATGIKFTKEWYKQQRHILELANEKAKAELRTLKTTIHTQFLFQSLISLENSIANNAVVSPRIVLQLSDLLSYMLYDCNVDVVPLTKEVASVQEYILFEKIRAKDSLVIDLKTYGNITDKAIVPAILLSFLQNCFLLLSHQEFEETTVFIEIGADDSKLQCLLSVHPYKESIATTEWKEIITDLQLRLNKFYLGKHLLEIAHKKEEILIEFSVILDKIVKPAITVNEQIQTQTHEVV